MGSYGIYIHIPFCPSRCAYTQPNPVEIDMLSSKHKDGQAN